KKSFDTLAKRLIDASCKVLIKNEKIEDLEGFKECVHEKINGVTNINRDLGLSDNVEDSEGIQKILMPDTLKPDIKLFYSYPPYLETSKVNLSVYIRRLETLMEEFSDTNKIKVVKSNKFTVFNEFFEATVLKEDPHRMDTRTAKSKIRCLKVLDGDLEENLKT
uniref:DUF4806 domain-containing protein n=1 Tax=Strongyloides papillosus TaxID=174720 RepID=A0A0N5CIV6_STREA